MTIIKQVFNLMLFAALVSLGNGCATLPNVTEKIDDVPPAQQPRQIRWDEWKARPLLPRIRDWFVNLFVRWL
jgi:hypothetical protein